MEGKLFSQKEELVFRSLSLEDQQEHLLAKYKERNVLAQAGGVVLVGDSLTEFLPHGRMGVTNLIYNRGIRGIGIDFLLEHVGTLILDLKPSQLFLLVGTNDLMFGLSPEGLVAMIEELVELIKAKLPQCHIYLQGLYPRRQSAQWGPALSDEIEVVNLYLRNLSGVTYLDMASLLSDDEGFLDQSYTKDGVHLTKSGYDVVLERLCREL